MGAGSFLRLPNAEAVFYIGPIKPAVKKMQAVVNCKRVT